MNSRVDLSNLSDRELRIYRRALKRRRAMRIRLFKISFMIIFIAFVTIAFISLKADAKSDSDTVSYKYYTKITVDAGDTVWNISDTYVDYNQYKSKEEYINEVKSINHLDDDFTVYAGQMLVIPYYSENFIF